MPKLMTIDSPEVGQSPEPSCSWVTLQWFIWFISPLANFSCCPTHLQAEQLEFDIRWAKPVVLLFPQHHQDINGCTIVPIRQNTFRKREMNMLLPWYHRRCCFFTYGSIFSVLVDMWSWRGKKPNRFMVIQSWNLILKALWGAENSLNRTFQGEQPTPSVPLHYFTYLQPERAKLPPPRRLLAVAETTRPICCFCLSEAWVDGWAGVGQGAEGGDDGRL